MTIERWLPVVGYEGFYEVSDCGNVRRIAKTRNGKNPKRGNRFQSVLAGYVRIALTGINRRQFYVHVLVARAFLGPAPEGHEVNHKDGCGTNNHLENLEYMMRLQNIRHARHVLGRHGPEGVQCRTARLTPDDVRAIRQLRAEGLSYRVIGERFGVTLQNIHYICVGRYWKQVL